MRSRAPWTALLLVPLLALTSVLVPGASAIAAPLGTVTAEVTGASESGGLTVHVTGSGFDSVTGAYAAIIEKGTESSVGTGGGYVVFGYWMPPAAGFTGTFDRTLTAPTANLDRTKQYEFLVWQGHSAPDASTIYARTDVAVSPEQWNAVFPPTPTIGTSVTDASAATGATVRIVGTGFDGVTGAYAAVIEKGTESSVSAGGGYVAFGYWMPPAAGITGGAFDRTLVAPTANLDRTKQYEVIVWQGHSNPDATTIYARDDVEISGLQWNTILPPAYGITVTPTSELAAGATVTVTGTFPTSYTATNGSTPATGVYLMYCVEPAGVPGSGASGRATGAANCNSPSQQWLAQPGATGGPTAIGTVVDGVWTFTSTLTLPDTFGTNVCNDAEDATKQCGIAVRLDHNSGSGANATYTYDQFVPVTFAAPAPEPEFGIMVTPSTELEDGDTVTVTGTFPATIEATLGASAGQALTTGVYLMYCAEPAGEVGTSGGRASGALCDSSQQKYLAAAAGPAGATVAGTVTDGVWTFTSTLTLADAFGTHECAATTDDAEQCGIFVRLYHGFTAGNVADPYAYDQFVPVTFAAPAPEPVPSITAQATAATAADGLTVRVVGDGFDGITGVYAALIEKGTESSVGTSGGYAAFGYWMPPAAGITDGAFDRTLVAPASALDATTQYEVIVWQGHSAPDATTIYDRADVTVSPEQWAAIFPEVPTITAGATAATAADGLTVNVVGTSFGSITTAYAAIIEKGTESQVTSGGGYAGFGYWATPGSITGGAFDKDIVAPTAKLDKTKQYEVIVWQAHTNPDATTIYARADVTVTPEQWAALFPTTPENPGTTPTAPSPGAGSLVWGVKASFRSYVTGPIAGGAITTSGVGATVAGYVFPQAGAASLTGGIGSVAYSGSVRFTGHGGALDLRLSDPQVRVESATSGTLLVRVNGGERIGFASLALSGTGSTLADGSVRFTDAGATLTPAGADAFESFYGAGTALDPVTFTVGSAGAPLGGTVVRASASTVTAANTPDATPPATEGITVTGDPVEGGTITAEADGFQPNETGILAVIYSTPTVLAEGLTADANGRVTWTGTLPRGLTGEHTLTFQGSVDRGVVLDIAAAAELQCTVSDASLVWGFKESFRAYIDGSIANGEWTAEGGASYETPVFTWAGGTGGADLEQGELDLQFSGSVRFTGHSGALDTTVANPRIVVDGDSAVLLLDVTGTTQAGETVQATAVEFAELDLSGVEAARDGDTVTWADVPATLAGAGAEAFGTYPEGEALDPLTIVATVDSACGEASVEPTPEATDGDLEPQPTADGWPLWATILIVVLVLLAIAGLVIVLVRRRRSA